MTRTATFDNGVFFVNYLMYPGPEGPAPIDRRPCPGCLQRPCTGQHLHCGIARFCVDRGESVPLP